MAAYMAIQRQKYRTHGWLMGTALATSTVFLASYLYSHYLFGERSSGLHPGPLRTAYFILLASHVLLAVAMLPFIIWTVWLAARRNWRLHRKIAQPTFWVWLYVSVTGVVVYYLLYRVFPRLT
jgi:uncharacterized membrane protein YozB (DUF420 family)